MTKTDALLSAAIVIPARLESTRLPKKLLLAETGRALLAHTVEAALAAAEASGGAIRRIVVAADDQSLVDVARAAGAHAVLTDVAHQSGTDRIAEAARDIEEQVLINVQGDEPEIEPSVIVRALELMADGEAPMASLAFPIYDEASFRNPNVVKVVLNAVGDAVYFSRAPIPFPRDGSPVAFAALGEGVWGYGHLGLYAYRRDFLLGFSALPVSGLERRERLEQLRVIEAGHRIRMAIVSPPKGEAIDTREAYDAFRRRLGARKAGA